MGANGTPLFEIQPENKPAKIGEVEKAVREEIERKIHDGILDRQLYAGQIAQAIAAAQELDASKGVGRPSGRAQFHDVVHRMLMDLPQPERTVQASELELVLQAIRDEEI